MKSLLKLCAIFALCTTSAWAAPATDTAKADFENFVQAADNDDAVAAKSYVAQSGQELFGRFTSYGLLKCLPKDSQYNSEEQVGNYRLVKAGMTALDGKWKVSRLYFIKEGSGWKLDINETLRRGVGENWQNQVHTAEQFYLLMKQQMGDRLDCKAIRQLAAPMAQPAQK